MDLMVERLGRDLDRDHVRRPAGHRRSRPRSTSATSRRSPTTRSAWAIRAAKARGLKVCLKPVVNVRERDLARAHQLLRHRRPAGAEVVRVVRQLHRVHRPPRAHRRRGGRRDALHRLRDGADRPPRGRVARADRRGPRGLRRPGHLQLRQVPGGPRRLVGRGRRHLVVAATTRSTTGRTSWTASSRWSPRTASRSSSWRPAAPAASAPPRCPTTGPCAGAPSEQAQVDWYEAAFTACARRDWVARLHALGLAGPALRRGRRRDDDDYCMFGKAAESVVRDAYAEVRSVGQRTTTDFVDLVRERLALGVPQRPEVAEVDRTRRRSARGRGRTPSPRRAARRSTRAAASARPPSCPTTARSGPRRPTGSSPTGRQRHQGTAEEERAADRLTRAAVLVVPRRRDDQSHHDRRPKKYGSSASESSR